MIAGVGEKVTLKQVAQYADACNLDESKLPDAPRDIPKKIAAIERHCEAIGRDPSEILRTHFVGWLMLAPTEAEVKEKIARYYPDGLPAAFDRFVMAGHAGADHRVVSAASRRRHPVFRGPDARRHRPRDARSARQSGRTERRIS